MKRKKILIVDDAETVLLMERMILNREYDLVTARDGREAVAKASAERPDLILMDIVMPVMDGFDACSKVREQQNTSEIPVILVTTRGEPANVERGYRSGCTDYVTKPVDSVELLAKIRNCLGN
jgi:PleD family two-component response regulator